MTSSSSLRERAADRAGGPRDARRRALTRPIQLRGARPTLACRASLTWVSVERRRAREASRSACETRRRLRRRLPGRAGRRDSAAGIGRTSGISEESAFGQCFTKQASASPLPDMGLARRRRRVSNQVAGALPRTSCSPRSATAHTPPITRSAAPCGLSLRPPAQLAAVPRRLRLGNHDVAPVNRPFEVDRTGRRRVRRQRAAAVSGDSQVRAERRQASYSASAAFRGGQASGWRVSLPVIAPRRAERNHRPFELGGHGGSLRSLLPQDLQDVFERLAAQVRYPRVGGRIAHRYQQARRLIVRTVQDLRRKPIGLGVWVSATSPAWCTAVRNRPAAMPTDSDT